MTDIPDINELDINEKWAPQLGYAEEPEFPLTADSFPSKSGGKPAWLNPEKVLSINDVTCGLCEQPMVLLVQLYTPEDFPPEAFHRTIYVFCCKNGSCVKQDWKKCFKVFRSQLPKENGYYPPPPEEDEEEEDIEFTPKSYKPPTLCVICGIEGTKACGQCKSTHYCSKEHQMVDWNMCLHKQYCKKIKDMNSQEKEQVEQLRQKRIFQEMEIVSEPEGRGEDGEEEDAQLAHTLANSKNEEDDQHGNNDPTEKALVPVGEEHEEDTEVAVDDTFLKFQLRIQLYPEQILRYDRVEYDMPDREPLWVQDEQKPTHAIPSCDQCGGPRTFEFQLLSTLLNYLDVSHIANDSLDWGSLFIYSCKKNCAIDNNDKVFLPEFIWKQDFSSHGMNLGGHRTQ
ncbi:unnamed protein product [Cunninghamella blakesleeana]